MLIITPEQNTRETQFNLAVPQHGLDGLHRPILARRQYAYAAVVSFADQGVRTDVVVDMDEFQVDIGLPIERYVDVSWKYPPTRTIIQFDNVTFGVSKNFHGLVFSIFVSRDFKYVNAETTSLCSSVGPVSINSNT